MALRFFWPKKGQGHAKRPVRIKDIRNVWLPPRGARGEVTQPGCWDTASPGHSPALPPRSCSSWTEPSHRQRAKAGLLVDPILRRVSQTLAFPFFDEGNGVANFSCLDTDFTAFNTRTSYRDPFIWISRGWVCPCWISSFYFHTFRQKRSLSWGVAITSLTHYPIKGAAIQMEAALVSLFIVRCTSLWYFSFYFT